MQSFLETTSACVQLLVELSRDVEILIDQVISQVALSHLEMSSSRLCCIGRLLNISFSEAREPTTTTWELVSKVPGLIGLPLS